MLCNRTKGRSRMDETFGDKAPSGCLATLKLTKKLKGLRNGGVCGKKRAAKIGLTTPGMSKSQTRPLPQVVTPQNTCDDKENARSTGMSCRSASRLNGLGVRGQLKVSLEVEDGVLTVHAVEGKNLKFKQGSSGDSYVQVSVQPQDDSMMRYTTKIVYNTTNPHYDETFKHELVSGDERKRVHIAVWSEVGIYSQLVGCMSFGVKHLLYRWRSVSGWFYLLNEELGSKKHLKMFSSRQALGEKNSNVPSVNADTEGLKSMTLLVTPDPQQYGYGFSVNGACPSTVADVQPGSAAAAAGLRPGDCIIKIDTQNVSRSTSTSINKIISEADETLVMEVRRHGDVEGVERSVSASRSRLVPCSSMSTLASWAPFDDINNNKESCRPKRAGSRSSLNSYHSSKSRDSQSHKSQSHTSSSLPKSKDSGSLKRMASQGSLRSNTKRLEPICEEPSPSPLKCHQRAQHVSTDSDFVLQWKQSRKSCDGESDHGFQNVEQECWEIVAELDRAIMPKKASVSMIPNASLSTNANDDETLFTTRNDTTEFTAQEETVSEWDHLQISNTTMGGTFVSCTTEHYQSGYSVSQTWNTTHATTQCSSIFVDPKLLEVAERLLACEEEFASKMHFGTERFSRPLRHCILTSVEHKTLFQNVEKLVAISEFHVKKLNELKYEGGSGVSAAYLPQLALMCDAYTTYCQGLARSLSLLEDQSRHLGFMQFVQEPEVPEEELNITEFVEKPLLHLEELVYHINQLVAEMPRGDVDFANMRHVLSALKGCYINLQAEFTLLQDDGDSDDDVIDEDDEVIMEADRVFQNNVGSAGVSPASSGQSLATIFSIDSEVAAFQNRLSFPQWVQPFQVVAPNRHIIYQGQLYWVDGWKWVKLHVTLFSDILLLTTEETPGRHLAVMSPVLLKDITSWDFECFHHSEFVLMLDSEESILDEDLPREPRLQTLVFRAPEVEQKCTWRHLLEQRVKACRSQLEYSL